MNLNKKQKIIYDWLLERPGYLKKGLNQLCNLKSADLENDRKDIEIALKQARADYRPFKAPSKIFIPKVPKKSFKSTVWGKKLEEASKQVLKERSIKRLFFDIETSPNIVYTWNIGYDLKIDYQNIITERAVICICYKWEHEKEVHSLYWDKGNDKQMIRKFFDIITEADEIIGHNSDKFDMKWFKARALYHGIFYMPEFKTIDTLKISRQNFKFNSHRLDYIGQFLGLGKKVDTGGFGLWKDIIENNGKESLNKMITYCKGDVLLLEKIYNVFKGYSKPKTHIGVLKGNGKCSCPTCGSDNSYSKGYKITASGTHQMKRHCQSCGHYFTVGLLAWANKDK